MFNSDLLEGWRELLPPYVKVSAGPLLNYASALTCSEHASAGVVGAERLRELEAGRVYAKLALSMLGIDGIELPMGPDRAPVWPNGVVGSITHARAASDSHVAAAVGRACDVRAIGIDVEFDRALRPEVWPIVLTERERTTLSSLSVADRGLEVLNIWCMKEAATKAFQRSINPAEIETDYNQSTDQYRLTWNGPDCDKPPTILRGRTKRLLGFVMAAVIF